MNSFDKFAVTPAGTIAATVERLSAGDSRHSPSGCWIVREEVLTLEIEGIGTYALMWTPTDEIRGDTGYTRIDGILAPDGYSEALALAVGFTFTEGIINTLSDIEAMWICADRPDVVHIRVLRPEAVAVQRRNVVINSSCGVCGSHEQMMACLTGLPGPTDQLRIGIEDFCTIRATMQAYQHIFSLTGGTHGAVLFDQSLTVVASAEDIGRHNALDKVIGQRLLSGEGFGGCGAFLSSRASLEMTTKAVRAGLEMLATLSAPTTLAIDLANRHDLTLCGFVRENRATIYSHPRRIVAAQSRQPEIAGDGAAFPSSP